MKVLMMKRIKKIINWINVHWKIVNPEWSEMTLFQKIFGKNGFGLIILIIFLILLTKLLIS